MERVEVHVTSGSKSQSSPLPPKEVGCLTHLGEVAGGWTKPPLQGRPGDPKHKCKSQASRKKLGDQPMNCQIPSPHFLWVPPLSLLASLATAPVLGFYCTVVPCLHLSCSLPPQHPLPKVGAATHKLREVWGLGPTALGRAPGPLRGSGLLGPLLGRQVVARGSRAGVGDRHRHRDRGGRVWGLRSKRALHCTEELPGKHC